LKNNEVTKQRGMEERGFMIVSTYVEAYGRILKYDNGIIIHVKNM
jgi:hypothetical protein